MVKSMVLTRTGWRPVHRVEDRTGWRDCIDLALTDDDSRPLVVTEIAVAGGKLYGRRRG